MRIKSFAKINLGLEVIRKREDNYHEIRTLFQTIDFSDALQFLPASNNKILLKGDDKSIPWGKENLIFKAAALLKERFSISEGIEIQLVYNPTRQWRIMLNYSEQEGVYTGIGPRLTQYYDEFVPAEWQSGWDSIPYGY